MGLGRPGMGILCRDSRPVFQSVWIVPGLDLHIPEYEQRMGGGRRNGHEMIIPGQAASGEAAFSIDAHYYITAFSISAQYQTWSHPPTLCHLCSCLSNVLWGQRAVKRCVAKVGIWDRYYPLPPSALLYLSLQQWFLCISSSTRTIMRWKQF